MFIIAHLQEIFWGLPLSYWWGAYDLFLFLLYYKSLCYFDLYFMPHQSISSLFSFYYMAVLASVSWEFQLSETKCSLDDRDTQTLVNTHLTYISKRYLASPSSGFTATVFQHCLESLSSWMLSFLVYMAPSFQWQQKCTCRPEFSSQFLKFNWNNIFSSSTSHFISSFYFHPPVLSLKKSITNNNMSEF